MANFPSILNTFTRPTTTDKLNSPSHSALHNSVSSALGQVQAFLGVVGDGSVVGTLSYDVRSPASNGGGHIQGVNKGGTGQTSFIKGDILVAQSSSVLTKVVVGTDGYRLTANSSTASGVTWTSGSATISSFLTDGIWTKPNGLNYIVVECWGGGGSGAKETTSFGGGGGGGGGYVSNLFPSSLLGATEAVNIGIGGASVATVSNGNVGGNTVFGTSSLLIAYGGGGGSKNIAGNSLQGGGGGGGGAFGAGATPNASPNGGRGGRPSSASSVMGDNSMGGGMGAYAGEVGFYSFWGGGGGGSGGVNTGTATGGGNSFYGGGGGGGAVNTSGTLGPGGISNFGGNGGAGALDNGVAGSIPGGGGGGSGATKSGSGGNGKVIIYEYI